MRAMPPTLSRAQSEEGRPGPVTAGNGVGYSAERSKLLPVPANGLGLIDSDDMGNTLPFSHRRIPAEVGCVEFRPPAI